MPENKTLPLISIALCTYNGENFLAQQIESLLAQDYPNFEIIVCDDCSSDRTLEIAEQFNSPKICIHSNIDNVGFNKNFERAFELCRGDLIAPCDQDDIWAPRKLTILAESIGSNMLAYCDSEFIDTENKSLGIKLSDLVTMYSGKDPRPFILDNCVSGHATLFRKTLLKHAIPIPKVHFFDWWLAYVAASCGGVTYTDQCLVKHRRHPASQTEIVLSPLNAKSTNDPLGRARHNNQVVWLSQLARIKHKESLTLVNKLRSLLEARCEQYFCIGLAFLLFRERRTMLFIMSKKPLKPIKFIGRSIFGFKIKKFH